MAYAIHMMRAVAAAMSIIVLSTSSPRGTHIGPFAAG